jgi:hypothetical protein
LPLLFTLTALALLTAARLSPAFAAWYAVRVHPVFPLTLGRLSALVPFSLFELLLLALPLTSGWGVFVLVRALVRKFRERGLPARHWERGLPARYWEHGAPARYWERGLPARQGRKLRLFATIVSVLLLLYALTCGVNYYRPPLADTLNLRLHPVDSAALLELCGLLSTRAEAEIPALNLDEDGYFCLSDDPRPRAALAVSTLATRTDLPLNLPNLRPKPFFLLSPLLSELRITGIYSPFTVEANYNRNIPAVELPPVLCHELAHLAGYMREEEANFLGYLAAATAADADFRYAASLFALSYALNALYGDLGAEDYREFYGSLPEQVRHDLAGLSAYWREFTGPAATAQESVNNTYLRANGQSAGVQSYGVMLDLLIAYYGI